VKIKTGRVEGKMSEHSWSSSGTSNYPRRFTGGYRLGTGYFEIIEKIKLFKIK